MASCSPFFFLAGTGLCTSCLCLAATTLDRFFRRSTTPQTLSPRHTSGLSPLTQSARCRCLPCWFTDHPAPGSTPPLRTAPSNLVASAPCVLIQHRPAGLVSCYPSPFASLYRFQQFIVTTTTAVTVSYTACTHAILQFFWPQHKPVLWRRHLSDPIFDVIMAYMYCKQAS